MVKRPLATEKAGRSERGNVPKLAGCQPRAVVLTTQVLWPKGTKEGKLWLSPLPTSPAQSGTQMAEEPKEPTSSLDLVNWGWFIIWRLNFFLPLRKPLLTFFLFSLADTVLVHSFFKSWHGYCTGTFKGLKWGFSFFVFSEIQGISNMHLTNMSFVGTYEFTSKGQ